MGTVIIPDRCHRGGGSVTWDLRPWWDAVAAGGGMIGLGVLLVPISLLGIGAAHKELPRRLRMYEGCATLLAFLFLGLCGLAAWVGTTTPLACVRTSVIVAVTRTRGTCFGRAPERA